MLQLSGKEFYEKKQKAEDYSSAFLFIGTINDHLLNVKKTNKLRFL